MGVCVRSSGGRARRNADGVALIDWPGADPLFLRSAKGQDAVTLRGTPETVSETPMSSIQGVPDHLQACRGHFVVAGTDNRSVPTPASIL